MNTYLEKEYHLPMPNCPKLPHVIPMGGGGGGKSPSIGGMQSFHG